MLSTWTKGMPVRFWAPNPLKEELAQTRLQSTFPSHPGKRSRKRFHWETARPAVTPKLAQTSSNVWKAYACVRLYTREIRNRQKKSNIYSHPHPQPDWNAGQMCAVSPRSCSPRVSLRSLAKRSNIHHPTPAESRGCSTLHHGGPHHRARFPQWPRWSRDIRCGMCFFGEGNGLMDQQDPLPMQMRGILDELVPE